MSPESDDALDGGPATSRRKVPTPVRRVVTGVDEAGRSCLASDGLATGKSEPAPGVWLTELWETAAVPVDNTDPGQGAASGEHLEPPEGGVLARIVEFPPDQAWADDVSHGVFDTMQAESEIHGDASDPMFHQTNTLDFIVVLEGEIYSRTEQGETLLRAGDTIVQRGTAHSWSNRSDQPCIIFAVLVSARPR